jgi:hypothetical protein
VNFAADAVFNRASNRHGRLDGTWLGHEECANSASPAASPKPNPPRFGKEPVLEQPPNALEDMPLAQGGAKLRHVGKPRAFLAR